MLQAIASRAAVELLVPSSLASLQCLLIKYLCIYLAFRLFSKYVCHLKVFATERILAAESKELLLLFPDTCSLLGFLNSLSNTDICWDSILHMVREGPSCGQILSWKWYVSWNDCSFVLDNLLNEQKHITLKHGEDWAKRLLRNEATVELIWDVSEPHSMAWCAINHHSTVSDRDLLHYTWSSCNCLMRVMF